jgi:hypothetical protein
VEDNSGEPSNVSSGACTNGLCFLGTTAASIGFDG